LRIGPQLMDGLSAGRSPPRRKRKRKRKGFELADILGSDAKYKLFFSELDA